MFKKALKWVASKSPEAWEHTLKEIYYRARIRRGVFTGEEPEYDRLAEWVREGDHVLDIGAHIGTYSYRLSQLVGPRGRVFAVEPMPATFRLLSSNSMLFPHQNVTLINAASTDEAGVLNMTVPIMDGMPRTTRATVSPPSIDGTAVFGFPVASLGLPLKVTLIKMDVEGHEFAALKGLLDLIARDHPVLIIEGTDGEVADLLVPLGYVAERDPASPNTVFTPRADR